MVTPTCCRSEELEFVSNAATIARRTLPVEQQTPIRLWSIARSPLMFGGGDLPGHDAATLALISNDKVWAADQHVTDGYQLFARGNTIAWVSTPLAGKGKYLAVFKVGDAGDADIHVDWQELGMPVSCTLRDLWARKNLGPQQGGYTFHIALHESGRYSVQ
jgi:alpha-galactosidase